MKKTVIFIVVLSLTITLLTATPAKAHEDFFWPLWPLYAVGVGTAAILSGTAAIVGSVFCPPIDYYPASPVVYGGGYDYYGGPAMGTMVAIIDRMGTMAATIEDIMVDIMGGYYGGIQRGYYGGHYEGGYHGGYYSGHHGNTTVETMAVNRRGRVVI